MDVWIAVGGPRPPGSAGPGGWDWWALVGAAAVFLIVQTSWRRPPLLLAGALAVVGGLIVSGLTHAWGVTPVWVTFVIVVLSRNIVRGRGAREV
jgi:hypothetical protein